MSMTKTARKGTNCLSSLAHSRSMRAFAIGNDRSYMCGPRVPQIVRAVWMTASFRTSSVRSASETIANRL